MYLVALIILVITGLVSVTDIIFDIKELNEGIRIIVKGSGALFWLSLLFFVVKAKPAKDD